MPLFTARDCSAASGRNTPEQVAGLPRNKWPEWSEYARGSDLPTEVRERMAGSLCVTHDQIKAALRPLAGRTMPWAKDAKGSLQNYLLEETELFPFQAKDVRAALEAAGWREDGDKVVFTIPEDMESLEIVDSLHYVSAT